MLQVGDIKYRNELGYKSKGRVIWLPCVDCGELRWVSLYKGDPRLKRCPRCRHAGDKAYNWTGGKTIVHGYMRVRLLPSDFFFSMVSSPNYVLEHRLVMAQSLGRCLHSWEAVHHINGNRLDNRIGNLRLLTEGQHLELTRLEHKIQKLQEKVEEQGKLIRLLQWQVKDSKDIKIVKV